MAYGIGTVEVGLYNKAYRGVHVIKYKFPVFARTYNNSYTSRIGYHELEPHDLEVVVTYIFNCFISILAFCQDILPDITVVRIIRKVGFFIEKSIGNCS